MSLPHINLSRFSQNKTGPSITQLCNFEILYFGNLAKLDIYNDYLVIPNSKEPRAEIVLTTCTSSNQQHASLQTTLHS